MAFTDEDFKRLKDCLSAVCGYSILKDQWKLPALIVRLEAAEAIVQNDLDQDADGYLFRAWRKEAGK